MFWPNKSFNDALSARGLFLGKPNSYTLKCVKMFCPFPALEVVQGYAS
jgi:hypothetical protein